VSLQPQIDMESDIQILNTLAEATAMGWVPVDLSLPGLQAVDGLVSRERGERERRESREEKREKREERKKGGEREGLDRSNCYGLGSC
jgi:hypothetical protein